MPDYNVKNTGSTEGQVREDEVDLEIEELPEPETGLSGAASIAEEEVDFEIEELPKPGKG